MGKRNKRYKILGTNGELCPKCKCPTQIREHTEITQKHLNQPYYFSRWFYCLNPKCKVTLFMLEKYKVFSLKPEETERLNLVCDQLGEKPPWE